MRGKIYFPLFLFVGSGNRSRSAATGVAEIDNESLTDYVIEDARRPNRKKDNGVPLFFFYEYNLLHILVIYSFLELSFDNSN